jgi:uncharacterized membrane protein
VALAVGVLAYMFAWASVALLPIPGNDVDAFFWPSAREALNGNPLLIYHPMGQSLYPNANGPLSILPLALVGTLLRAMGGAETLVVRRFVVLFFFSLFVLLMSREAILTVERLRGERLGRVARPLGFACFALGPVVFQGLGGYGHIEQPIEIWLLLLAARWVATDRPAPAGLALGLAVLARSSAGLLGLPLALAAWRQGRLRALRLTAVAVGTALAGLLPFYLADPADVLHSLVTYRRDLPVGAGSIWSLTRTTPWEVAAQHWDAVFFVALAVAANLWLVMRRRDEAGPERVFAALALTAAAFCLLAKTVWPYYFVEVYVFATIWAFARPGTPAGRLWRVIPVLALTGMALLAEGGVTANLPLSLIRLEGTTMFVCLGGGMLWVARLAVRPRPRSR